MESSEKNEKISQNDFKARTSQEIPEKSTKLEQNLKVSFNVKTEINQ
jgi:hypothetical protein